MSIQYLVFSVGVGETPIPPLVVNCQFQNGQLTILTEGDSHSPNGDEKGGLIPPQYYYCGRCSGILLLNKNKMRCLHCQQVYVCDPKTVSVKLSPPLHYKVINYLRKNFEEQHLMMTIKKENYRKLYNQHWTNNSTKMGTLGEFMGEFRELLKKEEFTDEDYVKINNKYRTILKFQMDSWGNNLD